MYYLRIDKDKDNEIKTSRIKLYKRGRIPKDTGIIFYRLQDEIGKKLVNHGNILAHTLGGVHNQVNIKDDKIAFTENGTSFNLYFSRGLGFCNTCHWTNKQQHDNRNTVTFHVTGKSDLWTIPIMYMYNKEEIEDLIDSGHGELFTNTIPSKEHENVGQGVYEYRIHDRELLPEPKYILVGKNINTKPQSKKYRIDLKEEFLIPLSKRYPNVTVIHMPGVKLGLTRMKGTPGNTQVSAFGIQFMDAINNCDQGNYDTEMEYIGESKFKRFTSLLTAASFLIV